MSYYRPSFSQTVAMARGRGFSSRGSSSYRGSGSRGSSSWGGGGGRGYNSSRGGERGSGRFSSSFSSPFDSRSKYPPSERYSRGRSHSDDYRKSYRSEQGGGYSGRENSGHRSPERKRMRTEAPSSRHENSGYGSSNDSYNASRYESAGGYSERRSFSNDRRPAPFSRRDEFRKPSGPPVSSTPRGGYRGRISSRGSRGLRLRDRPIRRRLAESSYAVRKRASLATRSSYYARRLKISRLRSAAARRAIKKKSPIKTDSEEEKSDEENKDEEEENKNEPQENGDVGDGENENPENETNAGEEKKVISPKKEKDTSEKEEKKDESDAEEKSRKSRFIKLTCPHCLTRSPTFSKYSLHLQSSKHMAAMRRVAIKQKSILAQMRLTQRNTQREVEKTTEDLAPRTSFCPLCKLNYKQPKATHQSSESHKNMKKFLMPYCKICRITFKSPMLYENHLCSIEHIKRKSRFEVNGENDSNEEDNLENFMTIDSVGDVDDEEGDTKKEKDEGSDSSTKPKEKINVGIEQVRKVEVYYCDLCRMYLPRVDDDELQRVLTTHCRQRTHLRQYVRYKEDKDLAKRAERLQRKETAEKESREKKMKEDKVAEKKESEVKSEGGSKEEEKDKGISEEEARDDTLWASVDKDLGDLLAEAESGNKSSDEDDDSHATGERYDR